MQGKAKTLLLSCEFFRIVTCWLDLLVQVAKSFLVFIKSEVEVASFKGFVAEVLAFVGDLEEIGSFKILALIFRKVFIWIAMNEPRSVFPISRSRCCKNAYPVLSGTFSVAFEAASPAS